MNFEEAIQTLKGHRFDLVLLCHTLSAKQMNEVGNAAHELQDGVCVLQVVSDFRALRVGRGGRGFPS